VLRRRSTSARPVLPSAPSRIAPSTALILLVGVILGSVTPSALSAQQPTSAMPLYLVSESDERGRVVAHSFRSLRGSEIASTMRPTS
jgi:hypothetical protein